MTVALTRAVSPSIGRCELTHLARSPIDVARAQAQHAAYESALRSLGVEVIRLPDAPDLPDAVFVEDTALVLDDVAVMLRPGAPSRRPERPSVEAALTAYREIARIEAPATIDGGDVLAIDRVVRVGLTARSSAAGVSALAAILEPRGYEVRGVPVRGCLHLKSAATRVDAETVLLNPDWADRGDFDGLRVIDVDPAEPPAANAVMAGGALVYPEAFPRTRARLEAAGFDVRSVPADELAKAEGAVTCCSLLFES